MDCTLHRHLLEAYLDGELGFERTLEVEAHLASCGVCSAEVQSWKDIRLAMQGTELYHHAPAHLESKVRNWLPQSRSPRTPWFWRSIWAAGGAAFATALMLVSFVVMRPAAPSRSQDLVASHIRSLMADHLMDVVSTDQHTVKPWFDGKLDFAPPVQDFAADGYPLAGGRLDYLENREVAVLVYHRALHVINLYVWPAEDNGSSTIAVQTIHGYNVVSWKTNGFEFRAVSDLNAAELRHFARLIKP
ncbi:MAG TPA: anti-sigma factor [Candidatus Acidoferrales bacterium]|nr:anti-sigma factor [Candidatus Acidoferrales bacterium]